MYGIKYLTVPSISDKMACSPNLLSDAVYIELDPVVLRGVVVVFPVGDLDARVIANCVSFILCHTC